MDPEVVPDDGSAGLGWPAPPDEKPTPPAAATGLGWPEGSDGLHPTPEESA